LARNSIQSNWDQWFESNELTLSLKNSKESASTEDWTSNPSPIPVSATICKIYPEQNESTVIPENDGTVLVMYHNKTKTRYGYKDLSMSMKELSDWLNEDPQLKEKLPISKSFAEKENSFSSKRKFREQTIAEAVGKMDPLLQGIVFHLGIVGDKLCFKMTVSNLDNIWAITDKALHFEEEKA